MGQYLVVGANALSMTEPASMRPLIIPPGGGRHYSMGAMLGVFLADGLETDNAYCASTWWLEPNSAGPGAHKHDANEEVFLVFEGTMSLLVGDKWIDAALGTFLRIPAGTMHDFENRTSARAGLFNMFLPGGFEQRMPEIVAWFKQR